MPTFAETMAAKRAAQAAQAAASDRRETTAKIQDAVDDAIQQRMEETGEPELVAAVSLATMAKPNPFANRFAVAPKPKVVVDKAPQTAASIDSLADLVDFEDEEDDSELPPLPQLTSGMFDDETPASAPMRELPDDIDKDGLKFIDLIDNVYTILDDPELLGNVIRTIMVELKSHPQYMKMVAKDDVRTWVQAMRNSMGLARIKKTEAKAKRGSGAAKSKGKGLDSDMAQAFNDLGIDLGD